ncbi:DinB family protein [Arcticibacterium luteifluviistationis]|uniref:DUF1572 domain-containing protein n=1 Tax=Arcticibacterium luteifluviistationis TaxID=1784714 RepID=A0A2Z4G6Y1_9BACT|nr:DinB family protein [Arcticibacterium luteifluviistationis]AWV96833.1 hypothetical protein DJ013_00990 [Arcticibacterium luteifluviistationis]
MTVFQSEFVAQSIFRIDENPPRIRKCLDLLSETEVWQRPSNSSNSIGNLILHLCGNVRQYAISSLGNLPDKRQRDKEFESKGGYSKAELIFLFEDTINEAKAVIREVNNTEWVKERNVQGFNFTGIAILIHVVEHLSYHTGQIAFYTKLLRDQQLGFYDDMDLNIKNDND